MHWPQIKKKAINNTLSSEQIFDRIERIAKASGHAKYAQFHPDLRPYLAAAYDPFIRYYTKRKEGCGGMGDCIFGLETWNLLEDLATRALSGIAADQAVDEHLSILTDSSARLFCRILNKDLRMGAGAKTINKIFPDLIPVHKIMLAHRIQWNRVKYPCWGSVKKDGVRAVFRKGSFYSRRGLPFKGLDILEDELKYLGYLDVALDGELTVPGCSFQVGSGLIRSDNLVLSAHFSIFELPNYSGTFKQRIKAMEAMRGASKNFGPLKHWPIKSKKQAMAFYTQARKLGFEGIIIRPYDYKYVGSRSYSWMKVKPLIKDLELKVVSAYEGTGKYEGMLGGVTVEYFGSKGWTLVDCGSGFTDEQRAIWWPWPNKSPLIGQRIQMEAMEETDEGSLRHPVFKEVKE